MGFEGTATHYFNAQHVLPPDLVERVLAYLPPDRRDHALLYFQTDHYAARNAAIRRAFEAAAHSRRYATLQEAYEAVAAEFCLSPRRVWGIVRAGGDRAPMGARPRARRERGRRGRRVRRAPAGPGGRHRARRVGGRARRERNQRRK